MVFKTCWSFQRDLQDRVLEDSVLMDAMLLEVQRMYPPFMGGRRLANKVKYFHLFCRVIEVIAGMDPEDIFSVYGWLPIG